MPQVVRRSGEVRVCGESGGDIVLVEVLFEENLKVNDGGENYEVVLSQ